MPRENKEETQQQTWEKDSLGYPNFVSIRDTLNRIMGWERTESQGWTELKSKEMTKKDYCIELFIKGTCKTKVPNEVPRVEIYGRKDQKCCWITLSVLVGVKCFYL